MHEARRSVFSRLTTAPLIAAAALLLVSTPAMATSYTAVASGNWSNTATWGSTGIPGSASGDTVTIPSSFTITMDYATPNDLAGFANSSILTFSAGGHLHVGPGTHTNAGTINLTAGQLTINGTTLTLQSSSVFTVSNATINSGILACSSCSMTIGDSTILNGVTINNTGTIVFNSTNTMSLANSATINIDSGGVFDLQSNGAMQYAFGSAPCLFNINASGTLKKTTTSGTTSFFGGGNFLLNNNGTLDAQLGTIQIPNGTSSGTFKATAPQSVDFNGATHSMNGASIDGDGVKLNGGVISGVGGVTVLAGATLTWSSGSMSGSGTTTIAAMGTLSITGAVTLDGRTITNNGTAILNNGGADFSFANSATFSNNGVFDDRNTVDGRIIYAFGSAPCNFNNAGTFKKTAGPTAAFSNQGGGNMLFNNNGIVDGQVGTINLAYGTSTGLFTVTGSGFVQFVGPHTMNGATVGGAGGVRLVNGGTLQGPSFIIPSGATFSWNDGTMAGVSTDVTTINAGGILKIIGQALLNGRTIDNNGTTVVNNGGAAFNFANNAAFNNNAVFDEQNTANARIIYAFGGGPCNFNNGGTFKKTAGPAVAFSNQGGGNMLFNNNGIVDGQVGTINLAYGASTGLFTVTGSGFVQFVGPHTMNGATVGGSGGVRLVGGGIIQGPSFIIPAGATFSWNDGSMAGASSDVTTINAGGILKIIGIALLNGRTINNNGTTILNNGSADFNFANSATFNNFAVFDEQNTADARIVYAFGSGPCYFINGGTFKKTAGPTAAFSNQGGGNMLFNNNGIVDGQVGTINLSYGTSTGLFTVTGSGFVQFVGPHTMNGATVGGSGGVRLVAGGIIQGPSFIIPSGATFTWNDGTMAGASTDVTTINAGGTLSIVGITFLNGRTIDNNGTTILNNGGADFQFGNSATFNNNAVFDEQNTINARIVYVGGSAPCYFVNAGTFKKTAGPAVAFSNQGGGNMLFNNNGIVDAQVGTINLAYGTSTGLFTVTGSGFVQFVGPHTMNGATVGGSGGVRLVAGGIIQGPSFIIPSGATFTWNDGTMAGASSDVTTINAGGTLSVVGITFLNGRTINNNGTTILNNGGADFQFGNSATFSNGGIFDDRNTVNARVVYVGGTAPCVFNNAGALTRTVGTSTFSFQGGGNMVVNNSGTVQAQTGTIAFGPFTQTAGTSTSGPGSLSFGSGMNLNGGILNGTGTVTGNVTNNGGAVNPGTSPGALTISGNYTQSASGTLNAELQGPTAGTQYDVLNVTGTATLGGTLNVTLIGGYTPNTADTFDVLTFATRSGDFATKNLPNSGGVSFTSAYGATFLRLTASVTQSDLALTQSAPSPIQHGQNAVFTVKVTNGGPSNATNVSVSDTFSGGTFVSATSSQGSCSGTGPVTCSLGTIAIGNFATITVTINGNTAGTISNTATASANEFDQQPGNNSSTQPVTVTAVADLGIVVTGAPSGSAVNYTATVSNSGPDTATSPAVSFTLSGGTINTATSGTFTCTKTATTASCTAASLANGATATITITTTPNTTSVALTGTVSSATTDNNNANNQSTATVAGLGADLSIVKTGPAQATSGGTITYQLSVVNNGPLTAASVVLSDPTPSGLTLTSVTGDCTALPCSLGSMTAGQSKSITATYNVASSANGSIVNVASVSSPTSDPVTSNNTSTVSTAVSNVCLPPTLITPVNNTTVTSPVHFSWSAVSNATGYQLFLSTGGAFTSAGSTAGTSLDVAVTSSGSVSWFVEVTIPDCGTVSSQNSTFNICNPPTAPNPSVVAATTSGQSYDVQWIATNGATNYEVDESSDDTFAIKSTQTIAGTSLTFTHAPSTTQAFFYRVRAFSSCAQQFSAYSKIVRAIVASVPPPTKKDHSVNVPAGSKKVVVQSIFIPGFPDGNYSFSATTDQAWLSVAPSNGILTPNGLTFQVSADPSELPNGTFTGTLIVSVASVASGGNAHTSATTVLNVPVTLSLVTPVTPGVRGTPPANALVIPSTGHLDGIDSHWQSDIRISNTGNTKQSYALTFTPADSTQAVMSTNISIDAGVTTALDDIVSNWYGLGILGGGASGTLEIHPIDSTGRVSPVITTVASSRTYNVTDKGTAGQFIPAIPFGNFAGLENGFLSLQQIAQSSAYRTNFGLVEASGLPANGTLSIFSSSGAKLKDIAFTLAAFQQQTLSGLLAANGIASLPDGRVTAKVLGGGGRITAFASVVDNQTGDPQFISGTPIGAPSARYVLPGVADINTGAANWRTDIRVLNAGTTPQTATLTFMPIGGGASITNTTAINPGEVKVLDNVVQSFFDRNNTGGSVHVTTPDNAPLVVTGRTYNQTPNGTYGQFIGAVTANDAVGAGGRLLQVLQVENSPRYRTNIGVAEVTGAAATVEITIALPDSRVTPKITMTLAPFEYRQFDPIRDFGLGNVYNARVAVKVTGGSGKVTAYGSLIDQETQDPTYIPAQ